MLQRIQTVFIAIALLSAFALHYLSLHHIVIFGNEYLISIIAFLAGILGVFAVFSFKKRKRQILLNNINIFINALLIGLLAYWFLNLPGGNSFPKKGIELVFPVISMINLVFANIYIKKDDRLVKSVDRLR